MWLWWRTANGRPLPKSRFAPNGSECNAYEINLKQRKRCAVVITTECCNRTSLLSLALGTLRKCSPPSGWMRDSWTRGRRSSRGQSSRGKSRTNRWTLWDSRCVCLTSVSSYNNKSNSPAQSLFPPLTVGEESAAEWNHTEEFEARRAGSSVSIDCNSINHYWLLVNM